MRPPAFSMRFQRSFGRCLAERMMVAARVQGDGAMMIAAIEAGMAVAAVGTAMITAAALLAAEAAHLALSKVAGVQVESLNHKALWSLRVHCHKEISQPIIQQGTR